MNRRLLVVIPLTVIAVAAFIQLTFFNTLSGLPFNTVNRGASVLIAPVPGVPLPAELKPGDELQMQMMTPRARAAVLAQAKLKAGVSYDLVIRRGNQILTVPVVTRELRIPANQRLNIALGDVLFFALLILALLAIWRGRSLAAWGLAVFAIAILLQTGLRTLPLPALESMWLITAIVIGVVPFTLLGLYIVAYALGGDGVSARLKRTFTVLFALLYVVFAAVTAANGLGAVYFNWRSMPQLISLVPLAGMLLIAFLLLVLGYARAGVEHRLRIRWILGSVGVVVLGFIVDTIALISSNPAVQLLAANIGILLFLLAVVGFTYAVLRQRLVDVRIVLNRTLVYGVITAIVVGVFAAINALVERETLGQGASLILELIVPLALGIVLGSMRKYVDTYINRFLFRRQYQAEKALNDFARTCGFIEQPERLLDLTVQQVYTHSRAQNVALYEREAGGYRRVRHQGAAEFPERIEADDLAFVRLRAGDHEADLHELPSALRADGYVFSMAVRGKVIGALVCGPRPAEQYTTDERALLYHVAQQAGAALHALRNGEHERFVDSVASGALDPASAREQARQLVSAWRIA